MDIILLGVTVVSLGVALVMSLAAWRVTRDERKRSAARVAALSVAAGIDDTPKGVSPQESSPHGLQASSARDSFALESVASQEVASAVKPAIKAPWAPAPFGSPDFAAAKPAPVSAVDMPLNQPRGEAYVATEPPVRGAAPLSHASGFLGVEEMPRDTGSRQKMLAFAAVVLFVVLSGGLVWMMSGPRGSSAAAVGPNSPLELVSLSHQRQNDKLAVSGLVRNPVAGEPIQNLSAVVFLFDRMGTFVTSSRANVDFLKLGAGDESPFVVSLDAPATVARYRVSFRTDDGVIPHV
ncbi:MAG: hypothetical protein ABI024_07515, partial [Vicinamibacterales bacterium]